MANLIYSNFKTKIIEMKTKLLLLGLTFGLLSGCIKFNPFAPVKNKEIKPPTTVNHFYFYTEKDGKDELCIAENYYDFDHYRNGIDFFEETGANHQGQILNGYKYASFDMGLFFYQGITHTGTYLLKHSDEGTTGGVGYTYLNQNQAYTYNACGYPYYLCISEDNCGSIEITYLSPDKREFKGKFNMILYSPDSQDSIVIKNGHFWIDLDKLNRR